MNKFREKSEISISVVEDYGSHKCYDKYAYLKNMFCPGCGNATVWVSQEEDMYEGHTHVCTNCQVHFTLPCIVMCEGVLLQVLEQIKKNL